MGSIFFIIQHTILNNYHFEDADWKLAHENNTEEIRK